MTAYYNEHDKYAAEWLRNLILMGHIAPGIVDTRSIEDVTPNDLRGFTQCHFFAGIGVWSYALRRAGIADDEPVWTGSCPCQPFSAAGQGAGFADERHLWPAFHYLIEQRRPARVLGEQVASKDAEPWIDLVHTDMEALDYAFGAVAFPAAGVGAPHIRDRLYWVADNRCRGLQAVQQHRPMVRARAGEGRPRHPSAHASGNRSQFGRLADHNQHGCGAPPLDRGDHTEHHAEPRGEPGRLGHADSNRARRNGGPIRRTLDPEDREHGADDVGASGGTGGVADPARSGRGEERADPGRGLVGDRAQGLSTGLVDDGGDLRPGPTHGLWRDADWLLCRDARWRPVEPGTFPLAHGAPARVGRLRAYGNALVAPQAQAFIEAVFRDH